MEREEENFRESNEAGVTEIVRFRRRRRRLSGVWIAARMG